MKRWDKTLLMIYQVIVANIYQLIVGILLVLAMFFTCYIDIDEKTYFVVDSAGKNIISLILLMIVLCLLSRSTRIQEFCSKIESDGKLFRKCRRILLFTIFGISVFWLLATQYTPGSDQVTLQNAVSYLRDQDYSLFAIDGYLSENVHQLGYVWICYMLSFIIGSRNYVALQLLNAAGIVLFYSSLVSIGAHMKMSRVQQLAILCAGIFFFPLLMYSSFIYGNICGLAFSVAAIRKELDFFEKRKKTDLILAAASMTLAIIFKSNSLIFMIAMIILAIAESIHKRRILFLVIPVLLIAGFLIESNGIRTYFEKVSNTTLNGSSYWGYVAMGLQRAENKAPGWYNGYVYDSYVASGYNKEVQESMAKEEVRGLLKEFIMHPGDASVFFFEKTASEWNNPTFQCYNIIQWRDSRIERSDWALKFVSANGADTGTKYLDIIQFFLLTGAFFYCMLFWKERSFFVSLGLIIAFIGGFLFHLFWEAKGQYTLPYFSLLMPYAVAAYSKITALLGMVLKKQNGAGRILMKHMRQSIVLIPSLLVILICCGILFTGGRSNGLIKDTDIYYQYLEEQRE